MTDLTSAKIPCNNPRGERTSEQTHILYRAVNALRTQKFIPHSDGVFRCPLFEGANLLVERCPTRFTIINNELYIKNEKGLVTPVIEQVSGVKRKAPLDFLNYNDTKKNLIKNCGFSDAGYHNSRFLDRPLWHNLDVGLCNANPEFIDRLLNVDANNRIALLDALLSKSHSIVSQRIKRPEYWGKVATVYESVSSLLNTAMHDQEEHEFAEGVAVLLTLSGASHCTSLNGRNGEVTGSDDVKGKKGGRKPKTIVKTVVVRANPRKKAKPRSKPKRAREQRGSDWPTMNKCGKHYAIALRDPFDPRAKGVCVPRFPTRPSQKCAAITRFNVVTGTSDFGFALITPTLANNYNVAWYSGPTFAGTQAEFSQSGVNATSTTGVEVVTPSSFPYSGSQFVMPDQYTPPPVSGRIVSVGIRVWNTTPASDIAGTFACFVDPHHGSTSSATISKLGARNDAYFGVCNRNNDKPMWSGAIVPIDQQELEYPDIALSDGTFGTVANHLQQIYPYSCGQPIASTLYVNGAAPCCLCFGAPAGATFAVEIITHVEYIGKSTEANVSPNMSDSPTLEWVLSKTNQVYAKMEDTRSMWTQAFDSITGGLQAGANFANAFSSAMNGIGRGGLSLEY